MYQAVFVLLAVTIGSCMACQTNLSSQEFQQLYCNSTLVFKGQKTHISTSLAADENGWIIYTYAQFNADQVYVGTPTNPQVIGIGHQRRESSDACTGVAFPDSASGYLIFSNGGSGSYFTIEPCNRVFSWACLPQTAKDSLPLTC